jgi:hypothetical protein
MPNCPSRQRENPRWRPFWNIFGFCAGTKKQMNSKLGIQSCIYRCDIRTKFQERRLNVRYPCKTENPRWRPFWNIFHYSAESKIRMNSRLGTRSCMPTCHIRANFQEHRLNLRYRTKIAIYFFFRNTIYSKNKKIKFKKKMFPVLQFFQTLVKACPPALLSFDMFKSGG